MHIVNDTVGGTGHSQVVHVNTVPSPHGSQASLEPLQFGDNTLNFPSWPDLTLPTQQHPSTRLSSNTLLPGLDSGTRSPEKDSLSFPSNEFGFLASGSLLFDRGINGSAESYPGNKRKLTIDTTALNAPQYSPSPNTAPVTGPSSVVMTPGPAMTGNFLFGTPMHGLPFVIGPSGHSNRGFGRAGQSLNQGELLLDSLFQPSTIYSSHSSVPFHPPGISTETLHVVPLPHGRDSYPTAPPRISAPHQPFFDWSFVPAPQEHQQVASQPPTPFPNQPGGLSLDIPQPQPNLTGALRSPTRQRPPPSPYPSTPRPTQGLTPLGPIEDTQIMAEVLGDALKRRIKELEEGKGHNSDDDMACLNACLKSKEHREMLISLGRSALNAESKTSDPPPDEGPNWTVKCFVDNCDKAYTSTQNFFKHLDSHLKIKRIKCPLCGDDMAGDLPRHMRLVHRQCHKCGKPLTGDNTCHQRRRPRPK